MKNADFEIYTDQQWENQIFHIIRYTLNENGKLQDLYVQPMKNQTYEIYTDHL